MKFQPLFFFHLKTNLKKTFCLFFPLDETINKRIEQDINKRQRKREKKRESESERKRERE